MSQASFVLHGLGVSGGIAIGQAQLVSHAAIEVAHYTLGPERVADEIARLDNALAEVQAELQALHDQLDKGEAPAELGAFLDVHSMILADATLSRVPRDIIADQGCNAEWALTQQMNVLVEQFESVDDAYLRERKADVVQVVERVLKVLMGKPGALAASTPARETVLVAWDFSPADVIQFKNHQFAAFLTDVGGVTSHTAIVARSLNVPAVVALHSARALIREGELLIVDGANNAVIVDPDPTVLAEYRLRQDALGLERQKLRRIRSMQARTLDGHAVELQANIELPSDVEAVLESGAAGIGLFRSEFLFLNRRSLPSEEEQFEAYRAVAEGMQGMPVTIRTFDLGADKQLDGMQAGLDRVPTNPALGLRAVRLSLAEPRMFRTQLRAILRASHYGKVRILVPMLCNAHELDQTLLMIEQAKSSLREENVPFDAGMEVGGMVEVPAAVMALSVFTSRLDFLSIGTNDLIQYTLAIDRADDTVSHLYDPLHPAILRMIAQTIRAAQKARVPVAVCGEMAGEVAFTRLLLGMGLRNFSMHPSHVLEVKQRVLTTSLPDVEGVAARLLRLDERSRIETLLARLNEDGPPRRAGRKP